MATKAALLAAVADQLPALDAASDQLLSMTRGGEHEPVDRQQAQIARSQHDALAALDDDNLKAEIESAMQSAIDQFASGQASNIHEYLRGKVGQKFPMSSVSLRRYPDEYDRIATVLAGVASDLQTAIDS